MESAKQVAALAPLGLLLLAACAGPRGPLADYERYVYREEQPVARSGQLTATFLGTSTVLFTDGETAILTDGFFTRPSTGKMLFGRIASDPARVRSALQRAGITHLAAVMPIHSHHDHAMDAAEVARQTGAIVVGSESTANIARGCGLPESQIHVVKPREAMQFGRFKVTWIPTVHTPMGGPISRLTGIGKTIDAPLKQPAHLWQFREGGSYTLFIEHPWGNVLFNGGTGFVPDALAGLRADVVFLGIAQLGKLRPSYRERYFHELVERSGATRIIPVHWDDFSLPLDEPLRPVSSPADDFPAAMDFLVEKLPGPPARALIVMPAWSTIALYREKMSGDSAAR